MSVRSSFEAEDIAEVDGSTLRRPLLSDADYVDDDEEIVSQLLSTNERSSLRRYRCQKFDKKWPCCAFAFAVIAWMGLFASAWSTFSCDLVAVHYPAGGVELSITGVGFWSYQREREVVDDDTKHNKEDGSDKHENQATKKECVNYSAAPANPAVNMTGFFPSDQKLQVYSIVAPSLYFAATLALFMFMLILSMHPEVLLQAETEQYPATGLRTTMKAAIVLFYSAGYFHILSSYGLLHFSDNSTNDKSPICNPDYSQCNLGRGGHWASYAIFSSFFCGSVLCFAAYFVGCRSERSKRCC